MSELQTTVSNRILRMTGPLEENIPNETFFLFPVLSCLLSKGAESYADNGLFSIVDLTEWDAVLVEVAANAVPLMKGAFQVAKTQARKAMLALFMSAVSINLSEAVGGAVVVGAIVLPKLGFGSPTEKDPGSKCTAGTKKNSESASLWLFLHKSRC